MAETIKLDEFYRKMQKTLTKKFSDFGELHFLNSRTTKENINKIEDVVESVCEICQLCGLPDDSKEFCFNSICISVYRYIMLNTSFNTQENLGEDMCYGHLVDMCPALSPFLFIQIIWKLKFEEVMTTSLLFLPPDLCKEIIDISEKCMEELEFDRALNTIINLLYILFRKIENLKKTTIQVTDVTKAIDNLFYKYEELTILLLNPRITGLSDLKKMEKYERYGIIIKKIIDLFTKSLKGESVKGQIEYLDEYTMTYGNNILELNVEESLINEKLEKMINCLVNLFLKITKNVSCHIYLGWAEINDQENPNISLQRSIGIHCYYLIDYLKVSNNVLCDNMELMLVLRQFSSEPNEEQQILTISELCHYITNEKLDTEERKKYLRELTTRYKEWDVGVLTVLVENESLLEKEDIFSMMEHLIYIFQTSEAEKKFCTWATIFRLFQQHNIVLMFSVVLSFVAKYQTTNVIENTDELLNNFIFTKNGLVSGLVEQTLLSYLILSPMKIITVLVKVGIGHCKYRNVLIPMKKVLFFAPFMKLKDKDGTTILQRSLQEILKEKYVRWDENKFMIFMKKIFDHEVLRPVIFLDAVMPYINNKNTFNLTNVSSIFQLLGKYSSHLTNNLDFIRLFMIYVFRLIKHRDDPLVSRFQFSSVLEHYIGILRNMQNDIGIKHSYLHCFLEPMDNLHFGDIDNWGPLDLVNEYERRFKYFEMMLLQKDKNYPGSRKYFTREDFLRHFIVRCIDHEYKLLALGVIVGEFFELGFRNELEALEYFAQLTIEAACMCLYYPDIGQSYSIAFLLRNLALIFKTVAPLKALTHGLNGLLERAFADFTKDAAVRNYQKASEKMMLAMKDQDDLIAASEAIDRFLDDCSNVERVTNTIPKQTPVIPGKYDYGIAKYHLIVYILQFPSYQDECRNRLSRMLNCNDPLQYFDISYGKKKEKC